MNTVTIVQRVLPHYRIPFFKGLRRRLAQSGLDCRLVYGQEYPGSVPKTCDPGEDWAVRIENRYFTLNGAQVTWQPCLGELADSNLIVVEQANSLLLNHWLMARRRLGRHRLAFWGHGRNFQAQSLRSVRGALKRCLIGQVDWWFAYTQASAEAVRQAGFPAAKITVVQNSIDTQELATAIEGVTEADLIALRSKLNLPTDHVALYCGGMYAEKRLDFLLAGCRAARQRVGDFHVIFIGSGPEQEKIERAAAEDDWIHYVGPQYGRDRAVYFKASQALLMPGLVGLAIVDSFVTATPLFTTSIPIHSPEIAYLVDGVNGVMTPPSVSAYAEAVAGFMESPQQQRRLCEGCRRSAARYTLNNFVEQFASGISQCLAAEVSVR